MLRIINTYFHPQTQHNGLSVNRKPLTEAVSGDSGAWDGLRLGGGVALEGLVVGGAARRAAKLRKFNSLFDSSLDMLSVPSGTDRKSVV